MKSAARAGNPAAAMHRNQRRYRFCRFRQITGGLRQIKIALKLDVIMIGISDAAVKRDALRRILISCPDWRTMAK